MKNNQASEHTINGFGKNVFSLSTMRNYLSDGAYRALEATLVQGSAIDPAIADEVAEAMKSWALSKGATHYTHWFQPLSGVTAEKHDSFFVPDHKGGVLTKFSGRQLIMGESDASNFPSGGLRATFEARGYTAWDPTSPAFIKETNGVPVLCIPSMFCGHHGEALDKKTPLLRSALALSTQTKRMAKLFGIDADGPAHATLGIEQEYFLVDYHEYLLRNDLRETGRTLFGCRPARHQQMEDHYFGHIKPRVLRFMADADSELWKLGIPAHTRHNETAPGQFEIAAVHEEQNLAIDHNMLTMLVLQEVAERHGLVCLLHEKPFAGLNGSGKHNNWSLTGPDGRNWLTPGDTPHENALFLAMIAAIVAGVDTFAPLLQATVASAGNDHRLGGNEAPPAIISLFLGEQLSDIIEQLLQGDAKKSKRGHTIKLGVSTIPPLPSDATDRNRTSPLAFTGNKFEFRAVGSNQSCAGSNVALNAIVTWGIDSLCSTIEQLMSEGEDFNKALDQVLKQLFKRHRRILFDGDSYSESWRDEATKRGLSNLDSTSEALKALCDKDTIAMFTSYGVFSERELLSRYEIYSLEYEKTVMIEANCALRILRTSIIPVSLAYSTEVVNSGDEKPLLEYSRRIRSLVMDLLKATDALEEACQGTPDQALAAMDDAREIADELEMLVPAHSWPLPTYFDLLSHI